MVAASTRRYYDFHPNAFQRFGAERDGGARRHRGTDFAHGAGTLVTALIGGKVTGHLEPSPSHGFGFQLATKGSFAGRSYRVTYSHGTKRQPLRNGEEFDQGDFLSTEGTTGAAQGACCHVEVFDVALEKFIDPMILVKRVLADVGGPAVAGMAVPAAGHPPTVRFGNRGATVHRLQVVLQRRGHAIETDSTFGPGTRRAVKKVQKRFELEIDGICGPHTWTALGL